MSCFSAPTAPTETGRATEPLTQRFLQRIDPEMRRTNDEFGKSVALSARGDRLIVGIPGSASNSGRAALFVFESGMWRLERTLEAPAMMRAPNDQFGWSVAISGAGDVAVIGAPGTQSQVGAAYLSLRTSGGWSDTTALTTGSGTPGDRFGHAVVIAGTGRRIVVSAPGVGSAGVLRVYDRPVGGWEGRSVAYSLGGPPGSMSLGWSLAISRSGDRVLAGAHEADALRGSVSVYSELAPGESLAPRGTIRDSVRTSGDFFGTAVALSGDGNVALIGAPGFNSGRGRVVLFVRTGETWMERSGRGGTPQERGLGRAVALDNTGAVALAGMDNATSGSTVGTIEAWNGPAGVTYFSIPEPESQINNFFGSAIAISSDGPRAVVGARGYDVAGTMGVVNAGAAYAFSLQRSGGEACVSSDQCGTGFCVDGFCCDSACESGSGVCRACSADRGATANGMCTTLSICAAPDAGAPGEDAGAPPEDAGTSVLDSGTIDPPRDASVITPGVDAGPDGDGGVIMPVEAAGCGCRAAGNRGGNGILAGLLAVSAGIVLRRRARRGS